MLSQCKAIPELSSCLIFFPISGLQFFRSAQNVNNLLDGPGDQCQNQESELWWWTWDWSWRIQCSQVYWKGVLIAPDHSQVTSLGSDMGSRAHQPCWGAPWGLCKRGTWEFLLTGLASGFNKVCKCTTKLCHSNIFLNLFFKNIFRSFFPPTFTGNWLAVILIPKPWDEK